MLDQKNKSIEKNAVSQTFTNNQVQSFGQLENGYIPLGIKGTDNYVFSNYRQSLIILSSFSSSFLFTLEYVSKYGSILYLLLSADPSRSNLTYNIFLAYGKLKFRVNEI